MARKGWQFIHNDFDCAHHHVCATSLSNFEWNFRESSDEWTSDEYLNKPIDYVIKSETTVVNLQNKILDDVLLMLNDSPENKLHIIKLSTASEKEKTSGIPVWVWKMGSENQDVYSRYLI